MVSAAGSTPPRPSAADGKDFTDRGRGDRHQFRFIVAPEDGDRLSDLRTFTRDVMRQIEEDLGTRLDWVAVDHFNTGHPHSHVIVRGRDDQGKDLIIAQDYITDGVRLRAQERATLELGPETDRELRAKLKVEVSAERFTRIDRAMLGEAQEEIPGPAARGRPGPWRLRPVAAHRPSADLGALWAGQGGGARGVDALGAARADHAGARRARRHHEGHQSRARRAGPAARPGKPSTSMARRSGRLSSAA